MVRAPMLPIEFYSELARMSREEVRGLANVPRVRRALAIASPSLLQALEHTAPSERKYKRSIASLRRFLVRMSTRPTPFGTFAGVALAGWGEHVDMVLGTARTRTRLDMEWLLQYAISLEADPMVRNHLRWLTNQAIWTHHGQLTLAAGASPRSNQMESIPSTPIVARALEAARVPVDYHNLVAEVLAATPSGVSQDIERVIAELWQKGFLLTDLIPSMTSQQDPGEWLRDRLIAVPEGGTYRAQLQALSDVVSNCDAKEASVATEAIEFAASATASVRPSSMAVPLQVDMAFDLSRRCIASVIGDETARLAEQLLRLTPLPNGPSSIQGYRQAFTERYGHNREVPLLELLDPEWGLGPIQRRHSEHLVPEWHNNPVRRDTLQHLALSAVRNGSIVAELNEEILRRLETCRPSLEMLPDSIDMNVCVLARTAADINAGDFLLLVGPNLGAMTAGRTLGRFGHIFGADGHETLATVAAKDEAGHPEQITAELTHFPRLLRSANLMIRPSVRKYEMPCGVTPGLDDDHVIRPTDLVVGVRRGRFYVRWILRDVEVRFVYGHMLSLTDAPPLCRLLSEIGQDGVPLLRSFDWGPAKDFSFLPRVQIGRWILQCAQWHLSSFARHEDSSVRYSEGFGRWLDGWRRRWHVPRRAYLASGDYRLLHDLDDPADVEDLRLTLLNARQDEPVFLQEGLPGPEHAWLQSDEGGCHIAELVVSLGKGTVAAGSSGKATSDRVRRRAPVSDEVRLRTPGSEWLFLKLYGPVSGQDSCLAGPVRELCCELETVGLVKEWFFLRYSDPEPHLRLRFRGLPHQLSAVLFPRLCSWASQLIAAGTCQRFAFDTYEREVERYGGPEGMTVSEAIFAVDSRAVVSLLDRPLVVDRLVAAVVTTSDLLSALGLDVAAQLAWLEDTSTFREGVRELFRARREEFVSAILEPSHLGPVSDLLAERRTLLRKHAAALQSLHSKGYLEQSLTKLYASHVHMHCNRLHGDPAEEKRVLGILARTAESILNRHDQDVETFAPTLSTRVE